MLEREGASFRAWGTDGRERLPREVRLHKSLERTKGDQLVGEEVRRAFQAEGATPAKPWRYGHHHGLGLQMVVGKHRNEENGFGARHTCV